MQYNYKLKYLAIIISLIVGYFFLVYGLSGTLPVHTFCIFKGITGLPCPACGSTRATFQLFKGELLNSVLINPLGILTDVLIFISISWMIVDIIKGNETFLPFLKRDWNSKTKLIILSIICVNWIWNIKKML